MHGFKVIDAATWKRSAHCRVFRKAVRPRYCVGFELDVTRFRRRVKEKGWPFTFAFIFTVAKCANAIEEFRYRFLDGQVVLYDRIHTSFTYLDRKTELFKFVNVEMPDGPDEYVRLAGAAAERQTEYFEGPVPNDAFAFSALPWIAFTHVSHTDFGNPESAQPTFDWGKYREKDGSLMMPFAVEVHHSFIDGIHVGRLATDLQRDLDEARDGDAE